MKTIRFLLAALIFSTLQGQAQLNCSQKTADIALMLKARNYSEAFRQWGEAEKCLAESEDLYAAGEKILEYKIDNAASADEKQLFLQRLLDLYTSYDKNFPTNTKSNVVKKAMLKHLNNIGKPDEIYVMLKNAFTNDRPNFTDAKALYVYFEMLFNKNKSGEKGISADDVYALYSTIIAHLAELEKTSTSGKSNYKSATNGINALMSPMSSCDMLNPYYEKNYEAHKTEVSWLRDATTVLSFRNCTSGQLFLTIASQWYLLAPDGASAYALGVANMRNRNPVKATEYFNQAAELEKDLEEKAQICYTIATMLNNDKPESIKFLKKAIGYKPSFGKAYILMAQMYAGAGAECAKTEFEKKALYFLASQTAEKAATADIRLKGASKQLSEMYLKSAPTSEEISAEKMAGKKITFGCWINESVTIPRKS